MPKSRRLAISIRQSYVEQIFRAIKNEKYRSRPTNIRGRVYVCASLQPGKAKEFTRIDAELSKLASRRDRWPVEIVAKIDGLFSLRSYGDTEWPGNIR